MTWKIIADSSSEFKTLGQLSAEVLYERVPLTISIDGKTFVDDADLDIDHMMETMYASSSAASSACPNTEDYLRSFAGADKLVVITITGSLSGSFNAARVAAEMYKEEHPEAQIHLVDSKSAGGEVDLLVLEAQRLISQGLSFEEVAKGMDHYQARTKLLFVLSKVDNLVKNGRLSKVIGAVVGLLNIRLVGEASPEGKLEMLQKARGHKKSVTTAFNELLKAGYTGGRIIIAHRNNDKFVEQFSELVRAKFAGADIQDYPTSGLCSFYAEEGGLLMGYEV
ncbi:DegV family protein [Streptococcus merionis]|uniref:DegV family protein n=1 Tax=Streptococcus merionis TaxID=400065 RepID=A0A239SNE0_9STRE|nr:DegV family protein [Streptococcus merionis]SNU86910.1 degV family protein [Streptococcus merionis]